MQGFIKLFGSILDSTVWKESKETRLVWITMLAMADRDGVINASVPGLAYRAGVTIDECLAAIEVFKSNDPWSRTKDHDGKRIVDVDGGWQLLNYFKYREMMSYENQREKGNERQRRYRERKKLSLEEDATDTQNSEVPYEIALEKLKAKGPMDSHQLAKELENIHGPLPKQPEDKEWRKDRVNKKIQKAIEIEESVKNGK